MKPEAMRTAIAESEGWELHDHEETVMHYPGGALPTQVKRWFWNGSWLPAEPPNYPEDLNVILPLLPVGTQIERGIVSWSIRRELYRCKPATNPSLALAACEFYLKWKNLWKED